jgi:hypothetical protein
MKYTVDNFLNDKEKKKMIRSYPAVISKIKNPSKELQLIAIDEDWQSLIFIKKPTAETIERSIEVSRGWIIRYIEKPSEDIKIKCLKKSKGAIFSLIKRPSDYLVKLALFEDFDNIIHIKNPKIIHWDLMMESHPYRKGQWYERWRNFRDLIENEKLNLNYKIIEYLLNVIIPSKVRLDYIEQFSNILKRHPKYKNNAQIVLESFNSINS